MRKLTGTIVVAVFSALISIAAYNHFHKPDKQVIIRETQPARLTQMSGSISAPPSEGFVDAAELSTQAVVHITTTTELKGGKKGITIWDFFGDDFGFEPQPQVSSGSGVIISPDGYIVTNNHVVAGADAITVTLDDKKEYKGEVIGTDPTTDIAVLKIDVAELPYLSFGNSDNVRVGEWVLAVGNPFNLASTVTAGIVSAKARNINLIREQAGNIAIESFIQTDAVVNPGNSGGALVDTRGNLIGINTAIASPTGSYAGYSFAVPSNLVKKVVDDIMNYGIVQRGYMGVSIANLTMDQARELGMDNLDGVFVSEIVKGSGADDAGIKPGDVITKINGVKVKSSPELQELVGRYRPGDELDVEVIRGKSVIHENVVLKTRNNNTELITKKEMEDLSTPIARLGAVFEDLSPQEASKLGVRGGVTVKKIKEGIISENTQMKEGFVITKVNNRPVYSVEELESALESYQGDGVLVEGRYPGQNGTRYYAFGI